MTRFHPLKVGEVRRESADSVSIVLTVPESLKREFAFAAGQYVTLRATIEGEDIRRSYSISSAPSEGVLRVGVKQVESGAFSTFVNQALKVGDVVETMPPEGRFTLPASRQSAHWLAIAAGS